MNTPNVYADQIEYIISSLLNRKNIIVSLHPHNDRGTAVASAELALLAGADRVEGTIFGNGERTGNVDIITLALNMLTHGINPNLDFSKINKLKEVYERLTKMQVHERTPYVGEFVFTAFSGSHQDAISKGIKKRNEEKSNLWEVPYLPIDPADLGREYEPIIRINSQSGKGGVAYILENYFGYVLLKSVQAEFSKVIQEISEHTGELSPQVILKTFKDNFLNINKPISFKEFKFYDEVEKEVSFEIIIKDKVCLCSGKGNGRISAVVNALTNVICKDYNILDYSEHALSKGSDSLAASYVKITDGVNTTFGVGENSDSLIATIDAIISGINRLYNIKEHKNG
jgi:2-isopropylmalate synthase